jgi:hypothetical protein
MKKFNKFLALVLTLITVVAALPFGAFADAWVDLDAQTEGTASTVTLTLDAAALAAILEKDGISPIRNPYVGCGGTCGDFGEGWDLSHTSAGSEGRRIG